VLPARTTEIAGFRVPVWVPLKMPTPTRRGPFGIRVIGRLKPGVTLDAVRADLAGVSERLFPLWESSFQDRSVKFVPYNLRQTMLGQAPETMRLFMLAVGLVLLIAVANVASLALVRATARSRETSLRTALGASRTRIARLLVTEGVILSGIGAAAGLLLAQFLLKGVAVFGLAIPRLSQATIDARAFGSRPSSPSRRASWWRCIRSSRSDAVCDPRSRVASVTWGRSAAPTVRAASWSQRSSRSRCRCWPRPPFSSTVFCAWVG
jgi:hypothetical protein